MGGSLLAKWKKIIWCTGFSFTIITGRLLYLQLFLYQRYVQKGQQNFLRYQTKASLRGNITDRHGNLLATNRPVFSLYWQATGNYKLSIIQQEIIASLAHILDQEVELITQQIAQAERRYKKIKLAPDITFEQLGFIKERFADQENVKISTEFVRYWPHGQLASHALGYLGRLCDTGKMGMERLFEQQLQGTDGQLVTTINSFGKKLSEIEIAQPLAGNDICTTIDLSLQKIAEQTLSPEQIGALIVMDGQTGDMLAMVSRPSFDPAVFLNPIGHEQWQQLQKNNPFLNRACKAAYPPGSLFKLVTICTALEENMLESDSTVYCPGYLEFCNRKYCCNKKIGHGEINAKNALAHSCNVFLYDLATHLDIDVLAEYAHQFGLGKKTEFLLPEVAGLIPSRQWKMLTKGERWWQGETLSAVIGQSYVLATPLQMACMFSSIFTGWLVKPRLLCNQEYSATPLTISDQTRTFLQEALELVVQKGTGQRIKNIADMKIWAKTSTAQTSKKEKRYLGKKYREHAWFIAYFQYKDHKPLTMVLLVEHAGSSRVAVCLAKQFLLRYKRIMGS